MMLLSDIARMIDAVRSSKKHTSYTYVESRAQFEAQNRGFQRFYLPLSFDPKSS